MGDGSRPDCYSVFGYGFRFESRSATAARLLRGLYRDFTAAAGDRPLPRFGLDAAHADGRRRWRVTLDEDLLAERPSLGSALGYLEYAICTRVLARRPDLAALHGATVAGAHGTAFIAGLSGAGKSTLALALAARGYTLGGDDIALLEPDTGLLRPLPRCAHLDARSRRLLRAEGLRPPREAARHAFITPSDLGDGIRTAAPVDVVVLAERGEDTRPRVTPLPQAQATAHLLAHIEWQGASPSRLLAALGRVTGGAACYRVQRGRLPATADAVAALLGPPPAAMYAERKSA